jgi:8-oxo-dGTP pyrophosphatase MutT (NUDIX family)
MTGVGGDELLGSVVSAADVAARLAALEECFGSFPMRETDRENAPAYFETGVDRALEGWRGDAGAFVTDVDGRVLLIRHADAPDTWGTPGGGHEPGESFAATARREVQEETGLQPALTGVHEAVRTAVTREGDPTRTFTMLTVHFEGVVNAAAPDLDVGDDEILEARWFESPPEALHEHCRDWVEATLADFDPDETAVASASTAYVDAALDRLTAEHGDFPVRADRLVAEVDARFADWVAAARDDDRVAGAYARVHRLPDAAPDVSESMPDELEYDDERVLFAMGRGVDEWSVPGGGVDPAEGFEAVAEREVREEVGIECTITDVAAATRGVGVHAATDREIHFLYVVFDATYDGGTIDVQASELNGACWFREPPVNPHWLVEAHVDEWFDGLDDGDDTDDIDDGDDTDDIDDGDDTDDPDDGDDTDDPDDGDYIDDTDDNDGDASTPGERERA